MNPSILQGMPSSFFPVSLSPGLAAAEAVWGSGCHRELSPLHHHYARLSCVNSKAFLFSLAVKSRLQAMGIPYWFGFQLFYFRLPGLLPGGRSETEKNAPSKRQAAFQRLLRSSLLTRRVSETEMDDLCLRRSQNWENTSPIIFQTLCFLIIKMGIRSLPGTVSKMIPVQC